MRVCGPATGDLSKVYPTFAHEWLGWAPAMKGTVASEEEWKILFMHILISLAKEIGSGSFHRAALDGKDWTKGEVSVCISECKCWQADGQVPVFMCLHLSVSCLLPCLCVVAGVSLGLGSVNTAPSLCFTVQRKDSKCFLPRRWSLALILSQFSAGYHLYVLSCDLKMTIGSDSLFYCGWDSIRIQT